MTVELLSRGAVEIGKFLEKQIGVICVIGGRKTPLGIWPLIPHQTI